MFTLRQVITGREPQIVTYQLPISYDVVINAVTNGFGQLTLIMDSNPDISAFRQPELQDCKRATNGDCLLAWNAASERPGQHAMQALFLAETAVDAELEVKGPVEPYYSSNLCRFFPSSSLFDDGGAFIDAMLVESNGVVSVEIKTLSGEHVKTLTGRTTNGVIHIDWDLLDDHGRKYTKNSFESYFHIRLLDSNRSQTVKQRQSKLGTSGVKGYATSESKSPEETESNKGSDT